GTIGGGIAEHEAIGQAMAMLSEPSAAPTRFLSWNLAKDLGMTCAGIVRLFFEIHNAPRWTVALFGAGHVGSALVKVLVTLDCRVVCFDARKEWLESLPASPNLSRITADPLVKGAEVVPDDAFVLLMTTDHDTDLAVLIELLRTRSFPYVGVIGSKGKARRMREQLAEAGIERAKIDAIVCPMGLPIGTNQPAEIAVSVTAQLLETRDRLRQK
ncbi:MAG: XdhC family protein, partial [Thermoanaerobaculia bacterium]